MTTLTVIDGDRNEDKATAVREHLGAIQVGKLISALMPEGWSMHKLRHRFASRGLAGTNDLIAVQEALGHVSVATTQRYVKITRDKVRAVSEAAAPSLPPAS